MTVSNPVRVDPITYIIAKTVCLYIVVVMLSSR